MARQPRNSSNARDEDPVNLTKNAGVFGVRRKVAKTGKERKYAVKALAKRQVPHITSHNTTGSSWQRRRMLQQRRGQIEPDSVDAARIQHRNVPAVAAAQIKAKNPARQTQRLLELVNCGCRFLPVAMAVNPNVVIRKRLAKPVHAIGHLVTCARILSILNAFTQTLLLVAVTIPNHAAIASSAAPPQLV